MVNRVVKEEQSQQQELNKKARKLLTQDRQHKQNLDENMLSRAESELH